jgi:3-oxoacyl-[acyl-carrier-protein] synthase II
MEQLLGGAVELGPADDLPTAIDTDPRRARCGQLALAAARRALLDAGLLHDAERLAEAGVVLGTTLGEERQVGDLSDRFARSGEDSIDAEFLARSDNHRLAALVARQHGLGGPALLAATACSSGTAAGAWAYDLVSFGDADVMLAGGADTFTRLIYVGFKRMGALSKDVCRPFDKDRDGVAFGEGAGFVILEELEHARRRGAQVYAELAGYGISNDAHHITAPDPNGSGVVRAMRQALATTSTPELEVDYVSAHGTGTPYNDIGEMRAMLELFGSRAKQVPISSIKSVLGHTNGAAGAIETVACALAMRHQALPPTVNLRQPEPGFDLDYVPDTGRAAVVKTCLNLAAGFGGSNVCLVLKSPP